MSNSIIITVSLKKSNSNPPKLKLKDSTDNLAGYESAINGDLTTEVEPNNNIIWIPNTISGISELTNIEAKDPKTGLDLLKDKKVRKIENRLEGTIVSNSPGKGKKMPYKIGFKIYRDEEEYWSDPVLQMKI
ncbi:MAG: hypothetical protein WB492_01685 [Christiangramia sp.]